MFLLVTSSPLFALLLLTGVVGALPVHVLGTGVWAALITRADIVAYPGWFLVVEVFGATVGVIGLGVLGGLGEIGLAVLFACIVSAHVAALEWSRRRLAALLEGAHRPGLVAAEV